MGLQADLIEHMHERRPAGLRSIPFISRSHTYSMDICPTV
jgi:hypothetical protein